MRSLPYRLLAERWPQRWFAWSEPWPRQLLLTSCPVESREKRPPVQAQFVPLSEWHYPDPLPAVHSPMKQSSPWATRSSVLRVRVCVLGTSCPVSDPLFRSPAQISCDLDRFRPFQQCEPFVPEQQDRPRPGALHNVPDRAVVELSSSLACGAVHGRPGAQVRGWWRGILLGAWRPERYIYHASQLVLVAAMLMEASTVQEPHMCRHQSLWLLVRCLPSLASRYLLESAGGRTGSEGCSDICIEIQTGCRDGNLPGQDDK